MSAWVCVASGPSLTDAQCAAAEKARAEGRCRIIAVNDNWARVRSADVLYAGDGRWWDAPINERVRQRVPVAAGTRNADAVRAHFRGECWTHAPIADRNGAYNEPEKRHMAILRELPWLAGVRVARGEGLGEGVVHLGGNSGYASIGLAYLFGARRVLLIGFDMQRTDDQAHWFGDHDKPLTQGVPTSWIRRFDQLATDAKARGLTIINCTRETALRQFPRMDLREALEMEDALCT